MTKLGKYQPPPVPEWDSDEAMHMDHQGEIMVDGMFVDLTGLVPEEDIIYIQSFCYDQVYYQIDLFFYGVLQWDLENTTEKSIT